MERMSYRYSEDSTASVFVRFRSRCDCWSLKRWFGSCSCIESLVSITYGPNSNSSARLWMMFVMEEKHSTKFMRKLKNFAKYRNLPHYGGTTNVILLHTFSPGKWPKIVKIFGFISLGNLKTLNNTSLIKNAYRKRS